MWSARGGGHRPIESFPTLAPHRGTHHRRRRIHDIQDFCLEALGPPIYNQAVQDARGFMQRKLDELDGEVVAP